MICMTTCPVVQNCYYLLEAISFALGVQGPRTAKKQMWDAVLMHRMKCRPEAVQNQFQGGHGTQKQCLIHSEGTAHIEFRHSTADECKKSKSQRQVKVWRKKRSSVQQSKYKNPIWTSYSYQERAQVVTTCCNFCTATRMKLQPEEQGRGSTALKWIAVICMYYFLHTNKFKSGWTLIIHTKNTFLSFSYI